VIYLALLLVPLLGACVSWYIRSNLQRPRLLPLVGISHFILTLTALQFPPPPALSGWIILDPLGMVVLLSISTLYLSCSVYAAGYLPSRRERSNQVLCFGMLDCLSAMTLVTLSHHLGLLWVAMESTTLSMAPLIYFNRNARSIEATWKYMIICSVGIALALLGLFFLAYATLVAGQETTLLLEPLIAGARRLSPDWLNAAFIFLLVGFGTKMGLAPLHTWKPDAYGEAPGLVGALLAGGLVNCALLGVIRIYQICMAAEDIRFYQQTLVGMGLLSMAFAAVFMLRQSDFKRMLAYSSVEHVGILAIALGVGKGALPGALFHILNNGLTKGVLFLTAGNIHRSYGTKNAEKVRGLLQRLPVTGGLFLAGFFAITGTPPFSTFLSEFAILSGIFGAKHALVATALLIFLAIIFMGMASTILPMMMGSAPRESGTIVGYRDQFFTVAPPLALMIVILILGIGQPEPLRHLLRDAARLLEIRP
jgi:hydrogenase-4 component F